MPPMSPEVSAAVRGHVPASWPLRRVALVVAAFCIAQATLLVLTARDKSDTIDESTYIGGGAIQWAHGSFRANCEAPALPKWGFGLALRLADARTAKVPKVEAFAQGVLLWDNPRATLERNLFAARLATICVVVLGGLFLWLAARRFGEEVALAAHALWCFSPTILAHGSLATLDGWVAALLCFTLWCAVRLYERPTLLRFATAGLSVGLAAACKVPALGVLPVLAVLALVALWRERRAHSSALRAWIHGGAATLLFCAFAFLTLWGVYGFEVGLVHTVHPCAHGGVGPTVGPTPLASWLEGFQYQRLHGKEGHSSYLFGEVRTLGWWWFYLACIALKVTLGAQLLAALRLALYPLVRPTSRSLWADAALLGFPLILFYVLSRGNTQNGVKYLLPAYPFVMLWTARVVRDASTAWGRKGLVAALALVALATADGVSRHPHHLMYFNVWAGGPEGGPRYLVHGDDWCQDQKRVADWQRAQGLPRIFYTRCGGKHERWGINADAPPCKPTAGTYALHAVEAHRPDWTPKGCLDWLLVEPPDERLGHSIYVYRVDAARLQRLARKKGQPAFWMR